MLNNILSILLFLSYAVFVSLFTKVALHMFQQNRYEIPRYRKWQKENVTKTYPLYILVTWFLIIILSLPLKYVKMELFVTILILTIQMFNQFNKVKKINYIKPLVFTSRVKRQIFTYVIISLIYLIAVYIYIDSFTIQLILLAIYNIYTMAIVSLVSLINMPMENYFKQQFMNKAKNKLKANTSIKSIGITGSYGKTSSKNIINDILSKELYCLSTPASYNTPLGISICLNNELKPIHEVFICEMGADKVGEITELMNFIKPQIGVVTSIGEQHLQTFKKIENIIHEKMQMVELVDPNGIVVLNKDEKYIREYPIKSKVKQVWYAIDREADVKAENIRYSKEGTTFDVKIAEEVYEFKTRLLGKHNIYNILAAIAIGLYFEISISNLMVAIKQINFIPHRLELKNKGDYTIIDNAFNSNPVASKISLDVLAMMPNQRICITPGMIELGDKQDYYNEEFGKYFINKCDKVILVGKKQTHAILKGLESSGYDMKNVYQADRIFDAYKILNKIKEKDAYVLLENDLPDAFNV